MSSGIYKIVNKINGKIYIGSSVNMKQRWQSHKYHLRRGVHHNPYLQNSWNKYGEDSFEHVVLFECEKNILTIEEQKILKSYQPYDRSVIYNIDKNAINHLHMEELIKRQISQTLKGQFAGEKNPQSRWTWWDDIKDMRRRHLNGETNRQIADIYGMKSCVSVNRIVKNKGWYDENYTPLKKEKRFSDEFLRKMRKEYNDGARHYDLVKKYGISSGCMTKILNNQTWIDPDYIPRKTPNGAKMLDWEKVGELRTMARKNILSYEEIGRKYGVGEGTVDAIRS